MNRYAIQWRGTVTRDVGVEEIDASCEEVARVIFRQSYGDLRVIVAIGLVCEE
jgi:hypothetical protein